MIRLKSNGKRVRIVWVPRFPVTDALVVVEAVECPGWRREKHLHQLTGRPGEIEREVDRLTEQLWGGQSADLERVARVENRPSRFESRKDLFAEE